MIANLTNKDTAGLVFRRETSFDCFKPAIPVSPEVLQYLHPIPRDLSMPRPGDVAHLPHMTLGGLS